MKNSTTLTLLLTLFATLNVWAIDGKPLINKQNIQYPSIVRVYYNTAQEVQMLSDETDVWSINQAQKFAVVQIKNQKDFSTIQSLKLPVRFDFKMVTQHKRDLMKMAQNKGQNVGIPGFSCYGTVAETFQRMDQMVSDYPTLADIEVIGSSWEKQNLSNAGSDLKVLKLTNQNTTGDKPVLFTSSSIHAREYATAELNTRFAEYLLSNYGVDPDVTWILDNHEIHLSLLSNPDGREQAQTGILWRKNTNQTYCSPNSSSRGVDLNRNYPFEWGIGGSNDECSDVFTGVSAATEPEVASQMDYIRQIYADNRGPGANDAAPDDTAGIFIDIHSHGNLILWPWGYTNSNPPNIDQLQALGKRTAYFNNYRPQPVNDLVITGGGSIDASYGELGVASLAFELGTAFFQDCDTFEQQIFPDNIEALMYLARVTQAPYTQALGPDVEKLKVIPNVILANTDVKISGTANDDRYNQSNGGQNVGSVQQVKAYINELPIASINGQSLNADDGAFNQATEAFNGTISTAGLEPGKNLLYVQASDTSHAGGTYAQFIDVVEAGDVATLSGRVTDALTGLPIENALLRINQSNSFSGNNGTYQQMVLPGTADLAVTAENYESLTVADLSLSAGDTSTQNIQLQPFCELFSDDMESGTNGWQAENQWAISTEQSASPTKAWTDSPNQNYANNINSSLTSPAINITGANSINISYMNLCDTEAGYDYGYFEVQYDGGSWQEINRCDNQSTWQAESFEILPPNNSSEMKLRFRLTSDGGLTQDGWYIDDVVVKGSGAVCQSVFNDIIFASGFEAD